MIKVTFHNGKPVGITPDGSIQYVPGDGYDNVLAFLIGELGLI